MERSKLWELLQDLETDITTPWIIMVDFNHLLHLYDRIRGLPVTQQDIWDFQQCTCIIRVQDLAWKGCRYTWTNKQEFGLRIFSRIDHVLVSSLWLDTFLNSEAHFLAEDISDHSHGLVIFFKLQHLGPKPFKHFDMWRTAEQFLDIVQSIWKKHANGTRLH